MDPPLNLPQVNNNQETNRGAVSEIVDERTRFEMYYPPFAGAVKAGLGSIMVSVHRGLLTYIHCQRKKCLVHVH